MLMLSGYTLGFFFPKQAKHLAVRPAKAPCDNKPERMQIDLSKTRPDADSESREVPAALYFYRYF